jgi:hypothetical protein
VKHRILPFFLVLLFLFVPAMPCRGDSVDDVQAWLGLNTILWQKGKWNFTFWSEIRIEEDLSTSQGYFVGPGTRFRAFRNLDLEFATILLGMQSLDLDLLRYQLAMTPHFSVGKRGHFFFRSRMEWIRGDLTLDRMRHRLLFYFEVRNTGPLVGYFFSDEFFYNWNEWDINQNRFVPLGLVWKTSPQSLVTTYYCVQYLHPLSRRNHALGLVVELRLK